MTKPISHEAGRDTAAAIFAPLNYKWKGVLTAVAADTILSGIYRKSPIMRPMMKMFG